MGRKQRRAWKLLLPIAMIISLVACGEKSSGEMESNNSAVDIPVDTSEYYDYLLCTGGGYSIVAKQVESVTDVVEYVGVLDENYNWVIPLSDNTYMNPNGKITSRWTSYSSYEERCQNLSYHIGYAGDDIFVYGQQHGWPGAPYESIWISSGEAPKLFHVSENRWVDINPDYISSQSIYFTDGYFVAASKGSLGTFDDGKYVLIISSETGAKETSIYCESQNNVGQYSEGVFFSYNGFYDIDGNLKIDLSEYAGRIKNQPYFIDGICSLLAENENGTEYKAVIDSAGNFISGFEKVS